MRSLMIAVSRSYITWPMSSSALCYFIEYSHSVSKASARAKIDVTTDVCIWCYHGRLIFASALLRFSDTNCRYQGGRQYTTCHLGNLLLAKSLWSGDKNINYILGKDFIAVKRSSYWAVLALLNRMIFPSSRVAYIVEAMRWIYSLRHRVLEESFWLRLESSAYVASFWYRRCTMWCAWRVVHGISGEQ